MHLYIHIPYCISKCDYCDFFSVPLLKNFSDEKTDGVYVPQNYVDALVKEIKFKLNYYGIKSLSTIYIGGGTPSLLLASQLEQIMNAVKKECTLEESAEVTVEMNPETITLQKLDACSKCGINRISLGIQTLCDGSLNDVHRHCSSAKALSALEMISHNWNGRLSVDLIAGLPATDDIQFEQNIKKLVQYNPDHFSMYSLCIEEETPLGKRSADKTDELLDDADRQWLKGRELLKEYGFIQYEVSNFAKKGFEAKHNTAYWKQEDYIGCGSGACGTIYSFGKVMSGRNITADSKGFRLTNTTDLNRYISFWNGINETAGGQNVYENLPAEKEILDLETEEYEFLMMGLRMLEGIDEETYAVRFGSIDKWNGSLSERLRSENSLWSKFEQKNYVKVYKNIQGKTVYALNEEGMLFLNQLLESLL